MTYQELARSLAREQAPATLPNVLRRLAEIYREESQMLREAWQDNECRIWDDYAAVLDRAADSLDKRAARF